MVLVNGLSHVSVGTRQNEVKSTGEKTNQGDSFYAFLSKSMLSGESVRTAGKERFFPPASSGYRHDIRNDSVSSSDRMYKEVPKDSDSVTDIPAQDDGSPQKKRENLLYLIDEVIAVLRQLAMLLQKPETSEESGAGISLPDEIKAALSDIINGLTGMTDLTGGNVKELVQDLSVKMQQVFEDGSFFVSAETGISEGNGQPGELIAKMLSEAENLKAVLVSDEAGGNIYTETGEENNVWTDDGNLLKQRTEINGSDQENSAGIKTDDNVEENCEDERKVSSDTENGITGKSGSGMVNLRDDFRRVTDSRVAQNEQVNESGHVVPEKLSVTEKTDILRQVAEKVQVLTDSERSEMIIQLKPESLGRIQLQVIHERGEIVAKFLAENEQVKSILENNMQFLRDALEKSGVDIQSLSVSVGHQNRGENRNDYESRYPQNGLHRNYYEELPEMADISHTYRYTGITDDSYGFTGSEINLIA